MTEKVYKIKHLEAVAYTNKFENHCPRLMQYLILLIYFLPSLYNLIFFLQYIVAKSKCLSTEK